MKNILYTNPDGTRVQAVVADAPREIDDNGETRLETDLEVAQRIAALVVPADVPFEIVDEVQPLDADVFRERAMLVDVERDRRLSGGYIDTATGKQWQCRPDDQAKWTAIASSAGLNVLRGGAFAATTYDAIPRDNDTLTLSAADASALFEGRVMPWVSATILYARELKNRILAGENPDVTRGWPT